MSGKFLARASALSLAMFLAACGGDDDSTPLVDIGGNNNTSTPSTGTGGESGTSPEGPGNTGGEAPGETDQTPLPTILVTATPPEIIAGNNSRITVSAVDADGNKVTEVADQVVLNSICANSTDNGTAATFESEALSISEGTAFTNYTPTDACVGTDTISARWNSENSAKAEVEVKVLAEQAPVLALGTISAGGTFQEGEIKPLDPLPLNNNNNNTQLSVVLYDTANQRIVEGSENKVKFYSTCHSSAWASFEPGEITPETGVAETLYSLGENKLCTGSDTIYARLGDNFSIKAKVIVPIADTGTTEPEFEVGKLDSNGFEKGKISADPAELKFVTGQAAPTTELSFAIVDSSGQLSTNPHNYEFSSMCLDAGRASIKDTSNYTNSGEGIATYVASESCMKNDTVSVKVDGDNRLRASIELFVSEQPLVLGSLDAMGAFSPGVLGITNDQLGYNSNQQTETDISTAIAYENGSGGGYTVVRGDVVGLELFSTCTESGRSLIETTGTTETGELISKYTANECVGNDVIYGRIQGSNVLASGSVSIAPKEGQNLALGYFDAGTFKSGVIGNTRSTALPLGVQTKLYLSIADAQTKERIKGQPLTVEFFSECDDQDGASPFSTNSASVNMGYIEILYTAQSCSQLLDEDTVRAELKGAEGVSATAETTIRLLDLDANSLTASLPEPNSIAPYWYSTDDREKTSTLKVQLKDNQNNGIPDQVVTFTLDNPGAPDVAALDPVDGGRTNADGFAEVKIKSIEGYDNIVFRVIASYTDPIGNVLETYSAPIAVNSKLPFEEKFSISTSNSAPDTRGIDGVKVPLTLLAADNEGNRIRGNTVVNFETNIGSVNPECILDNDGRCTVTWESLNVSDTRAAEFATVRAYTHGTTSPANSNGPTPTGEIDDTVSLLMTTSTGVKVDLTNENLPDNTQVVVPDSFDVGILADGGAFCAEAYVDLDGNGTKYSPPVGTTMEFEATNATLIPASSSSFTLGSSPKLLNVPATFQGCTFLDPDPDRTEKMKLTVTVIPPRKGSAVAVKRGAEVP